MKTNSGQVLRKAIGKWKLAGCGIGLQILSTRLPGINNSIHKKSKLSIPPSSTKHFIVYVTDDLELI